MERSKTEIFIAKATEVHGDKYDYSQTIFYRSSDKLKIICKKHGIFEQRASGHLKGRGCLECKIENDRLSITEFIERATQVHGNKYDYSLVDYHSSKIKIKILCRKHGVFEQRPDIHLGGKGCYDCGKDKASKIKSHTSKEFIEQAIKIHGNKYDYSLVEYKSNNTKINIICKKHGIFTQRATNHTSGQGCPDCSTENKSSTLEEFIDKALKIHGNKYDYSLVKYNGTIEKIEILCKKHNKSFWQTPSDHTNNETGCPDCGKNHSKSVSKIETQWLDSKRISKKNRNRYITANNQKYNVDAYIPQSKTIYEFYGDYWHGNPAKYAPDDVNGRNKKTFGELYKTTIKREQIFKDAGYKVVSIWENDWRQQKKGKRND
jgi:hypothetical protein